MITIDVNREIRYVLKSERELEAEAQSVFLLKCLSATEAAELEDRNATVDMKSNMMLMSNASIALDVLRRGLKGWENVRNSDGELVEFRTDNKGRVRNDVLDMIPPAIRRELANAITTGNTVDEGDEKNSSSPSRSPSD